MTRPKIVFYHDIASGRDGGTLQGAAPSADQFRRHMAFLQERYRPLTLDQVLACLAGEESFDGAPVAVTFDDGLAGVARAAEILAEFHVPATVFLSTRFIGTGELPWFIHLDRLVEELRRREKSAQIGSQEYALADPVMKRRFRQLAKRLLLQHGYERQMEILADWSEGWLGETLARPEDQPAFLNWDQVRQLAGNGLTFGSHTHSHIDLCRADEATIEYEFTESVRLIREQLGPEHAELVAYPDGRVDKRVAKVARRHHRAGFATLHSDKRGDSFRIRRRGVICPEEDCLRRVLSQRYLLKARLKMRLRRMMAGRSHRLDAR
jgi:peptidoglycan/xylan/chitin deacetylase (PgdA/CDA1 family)